MRYVRVLAVAVAVAIAVYPAGCSKKQPSGPPVGADVDPKAVAAELAALSGTWVYERQVVSGKEVPIAQKSKDSIVISGNALVRNIFRDDGASLGPIKSTISVDPTRSPKQMDQDTTIVGSTSRYLGIYELAGDRLSLCYDNTGMQRPTTFDSPGGYTLVLTVLRRQGK